MVSEGADTAVEEIDRDLRLLAQLFLEIRKAHPEVFDNLHKLVDLNE